MDMEYDDHNNCQGCGEKINCDFDWADFHQKLDIAVAHMIEDKSKYPETCLPSKTTVMELMEFSHDKKQAGGCFPPKIKGDTDGSA